MGFNNMMHAISSKIINYYKWEALISFLGGKERKKHVGGKKKEKKKKSCVSQAESRTLALHAFPAFQAF